MGRRWRGRKECGLPEVAGVDLGEKVVLTLPLPEKRFVDPALEDLMMQVVESEEVFLHAPAGVTGTRPRTQDR